MRNTVNSTWMLHRQIQPRGYYCRTELHALTWLMWMQQHILCPVTKQVSVTVPSWEMVTTSRSSTTNSLNISLRIRAKEEMKKGIKKKNLPVCSHSYYMHKARWILTVGPVSPMTVAQKCKNAHSGPNPIFTHTTNCFFSGETLGSAGTARNN